MPPEDQEMLYKQFVCPICSHRFTTNDDWALHDIIIHKKQPTSGDLMQALDKMTELLELILVTASGNSTTQNGPDKMPDILG